MSATEALRRRLDRKLRILAYHRVRDFGDINLSTAMSLVMLVGLLLLPLA